MSRDISTHGVIFPRLLWDFKEFDTPEDAGYQVVYQATSEKGREFVIAYPHPVCLLYHLCTAHTEICLFIAQVFSPSSPQITGEIFCFRGIVKDELITILNTDKCAQENVPLYLNRVTDADQKAKIQA